MLFFWAIAALAVILLLITTLAGGLLDGPLESVDFTGGYLTSTAVLAFLAAFGLGGALTMSTTGAGPLVASTAGLGAGVVVGAAAGAVTGALAHGPTAHQVSDKDYVGCPATVTTSIPDAGLGQVHTTVAGHTTVLAARSAQPVPAGTPVTIVAVLSPGTVRVTPAD